MESDLINRVCETLWTMDTTGSDLLIPSQEDEPPSKGALAL